MPTTDESQQARQTYGEAPGWSDAQGQQDPGAQAPPDSAAETPPSDAPGASSAPPESSPAAPPEATGTAGPAKPFNHPPQERWDEVIRQRAAAEARAQQAEALAAALAMRLPTPTVAPVRDPWEGKVNHPDPATAQFWREQRDLMAHERAQAKAEALQELMPVIDAGRQELARITTAEFRRENPDIKPGSEEERLVVAYMNGSMDGVRHPLESAKKNALFDRLVSENQALKGTKATVPQKRAAAQPEASAGIPSTAGLPPKAGDWRERAGEILDRGGGLKDVLTTVFGGPRR